MLNARDRLTSNTSGTIDTTAIDAYTQGVEMTRQRQYDAGLVKVWSGNPGHVLLNNRFGMDKNYFPDPGFAEMDLFNPVSYLRAQAEVNEFFLQRLTYPIITGDNDQLDNVNYHGVIEPLAIREQVSFFSIETPQPFHSVHGSLAGGNINQTNTSDRVLTVDYFDPMKQIVGYLDMVDMFGSTPLNGFFQHRFSTIAPFIDQRLVRNTLASAAESSSELSAMSLMTGSTDNYVRYNQRSARCGWDYDSTTTIGTDSLAFGGMTH